MTDKLHDYYEKELAFVHQTANEFAKQNPATASRLQLNGNTTDDPLVARLLSGFAYQNARIQQKLHDDFPELTDAMLETLYPHYLRPIPSFSITQFQPSKDLDGVCRIDAQTELQTELFNGQSCKFRTSYPVDILPIRVDSASLMARPFIAPGSNDISGASAVLKISLKTLSNDINFCDLTLDNIRFFLQGQNPHVYALYDLLFTQCTQVVIANGEGDPNPVFIDSDCIKQVGFNISEGLLPYPDNSFIGYRLLTEFFSFPEKFHFVDFGGIGEKITEHYSDTLNIYCYLAQDNQELEKQISSEMFALGCTPVVNLFKQPADPINLTHQQYQYPVVPDARRTSGLEIYSIDSVGAISNSGEYTPYRPFYGIQHTQSRDGDSAFWFSQRRSVVEGEHRNEQASEIDIMLVNLEFDPHFAAQDTLDLSLTCTNRNLPKKLPTGSGQPYLAVVDGDAPVTQIRSVVPPTHTIRPPQRERAYWRLISHLNLNHLSLSSSPGSCDALKEILRLYNFKDSASTRNIIDSITSIKTKSITAPIEIEDTVALCRGTEVHLELDSMMLSGISPLLFSSVLERFFGLYCSINSFTRLITTLSGKDGELKRWPPRAGEKALV